MGELAVKKPMSYAEFLAFEEANEERVEFWDGEVFAMACGSIAHSLITANVSGILRDQLRGSPCRVFSSDLRVRAKGAENVSHPDVSIVCGPIDRASDDAQAVHNPKAIVEVLSDTIEAVNLHITCKSNRSKATFSSTSTKRA